MYFIDVDGVIRNLMGALGYRDIKNWGDAPDSIYSDMDREPERFLYKADPFLEIIDLIKKYIINRNHNYAFLSNQKGVPIREFWTAKFIRKYIGEQAIALFTSSFEEKLRIIINNPGSFLIDDYPYFFKSEIFEEVKDRVILVKREWNKNYRDKYTHIFSKKVLDELHRN